MFTCITSVLVAASLAACVVASPMPGGKGDINECNGGTVQCCNQVQSAQSMDTSVKNFLGLLGIALDQVTGDVGISCTAVNVLAVGGGQKCNQQQVCCRDNNFNGLVTVGCTPVNVQV